MTGLSIERGAALDFVLALRRRWADRLYPALRAQYDAVASPRAVDTPEALAAEVHSLPAYDWFAWLERGSQKMLWRAVGDAVADDPTPPAEAPAIERDTELALPDWYTQWDIHVQPGGVWSHASAARVYELGAKLVMMGDNDDYGFHRLFTRTAIPPRPYARILDLGCGFGKSTWSLKQAWPDAEVIGVDLAEPCLELAATRAAERGLAIRFRRAGASATGLDDASVDLVTSTMLVHELPVETLGEVLVETARVLTPGGIVRFLDFQPTGDAFRDLAMIEHGARNNEPFLPPMMAADLPMISAAAGLVGGRWVAFDERGGGRLDSLAWPTRPEWHFPWAVFEAEKPR